MLYSKLQLAEHCQGYCWFQLVKSWNVERQAMNSYWKNAELLFSWDESPSQVWWHIPKSYHLVGGDKYIRSSHVGLHETLSQYKQVNSVMWLPQSASQSELAHSLSKASGQGCCFPAPTSSSSQLTIHSSFWGSDTLFCCPRALYLHTNPCTSKS